MGRDSSTWRWGRIHHGYFAHALSPLGNLRDFGLLSAACFGTALLGDLILLPGLLLWRRG